MEQTTKNTIFSSPYEPQRDSHVKNLSFSKVSLTPAPNLISSVSRKEQVVEEEGYS